MTDTLIASFIDKKDWMPGPWHEEPDKVQWTDEATGLVCIIRRGPSGALCGYVGVPEGHPLHGKDYDTPNVSGHGGLTYAEACQEGDPEKGICHVPEPGQPEHLWWFGFDCAHAFDICPHYLAASGPFAPIRDPVLGDETYRDLAYVRREVVALAEQMAAVAP